MTVIVCTQQSSSSSNSPQPHDDSPATKPFKDKLNWSNLKEDAEAENGECSSSHDALATHNTSTVYLYEVTSERASVEEWMYTLAAHTEERKRNDAVTSAVKAAMAGEVSEALRVLDGLLEEGRGAAWCRGVEILRRDVAALTESNLTLMFGEIVRYGNV